MKILLYTIALKDGSCQPGLVQGFMRLPGTQLLTQGGLARQWPSARKARDTAPDTGRTVQAGAVCQEGQGPLPGRPDRAGIQGGKKRV